MASKVITGFLLLSVCLISCRPDRDAFEIKSCVIRDTILTNGWETLEPFERGSRGMFVKSEKDLVSQVLLTREFDSLFIKEEKRGRDTCLQFKSSTVVNRCFFQDVGGFFEYTFSRDSARTIFTFTQFDAITRDSAIYVVDLKSGKTLKNYYRFGGSQFDIDFARDPVYITQRDSMTLGGKTYYDLTIFFNGDWNSSKYLKRIIHHIGIDKKEGVVYFRTGGLEDWEFFDL